MTISGLCGTVAIVFAVGAAGAAPNQCVTCHALEQLPVTLGHSFAEWKGSPHGRAGVGCEACHGGDPTAAAEPRAHANVLPASDPASRVDARRIPATCGKCHTAELQAFAGSRHGRQLEKDGKAASCLTCHGAMATSLPSPAELDRRCSVCHAKPVGAQAALAVMVAVKTELFRAKRSLDASAKTGGAWRGPLVAKLHEHERSYQAIQRHWHGFKTDSVLGESRDLLKLIEALKVETDVRSKPASK